jgi:hypothetical protein
MIVQPDFLDHWKTVLLVELLGDKLAPLYVIRLWAHCQNRKTNRFPKGNPAMLKAVCKATDHDAIKFESAMADSGYIVFEGDEFIAHDWDEINASLISSWKNGKKGGRPKKNNPPETHGIPVGNPDETDKRREEKTREETTKAPAKPVEKKPLAPELKAWWNDEVVAECPKLSKVRLITKSKMSKFRLRKQEGMWDARDEIKAAIKASAFSQGDSDRGWRVSLDYLLKNEDNWMKVFDWGNQKKQPTERPTPKCVNCGKVWINNAGSTCRVCGGEFK